MKIYSTLQIGEYHINHCEDYLYTGEIGKSKILCAVMDGCTMGSDSYFAATLVGKLLRKIVKEKDYKEFYNHDTEHDIESCLKSILEELFNQLRGTKNLLQLNTNELLTTLTILLFDIKTDKGIILVVGDGVVCINGKITEFDQDNKPDYLGYHLSEDFQALYNSFTQKILFDGMQDVSIATDGIISFATVKLANSPDTIDPLSFLLIDKSNVDKEDMLDLKLKRLEHHYGVKPTDDLALIRVINDE
jgi:serine/threonine protein phosphatase PrpC